MSEEGGGNKIRNARQRWPSDLVVGSREREKEKGMMEGEKGISFVGRGASSVCRG